MCAGDVMVLGSDGLLDNCFPDEIASLVATLIQDPTNTADDIAAALAQR
jgi:serine/threonine protein phosphatase PrpC